MKFANSKGGVLCLAYIILSLPIWFSYHPLKAAEGMPKANVFSIRAANETLREVLKKISEASGYEIRFNTQLADEKITIQLENVNLNEALARVLQQYNHMSLWDDANDIITILIFKKNVPPVTISGMDRIFELATETTAGP